MKEKERKDFLKKWWLIALIPILLSACSIDENAVQDDEIEEVVEEAEEKEEPKENELIEVEIEFDNKVKDGILEVKGDTNLPRSTIVKVTVSSENDFLFEEEVKIGMMGGFKVKDISDDENPLKPGDYSVQLRLSPSDQEEKILEKIGDKGELLSGESIKENEGVFILAKDTIRVDEIKIEKEKFSDIKLDVNEEFNFKLFDVIIDKVKVYEKDNKFYADIKIKWTNRDYQYGEEKSFFVSTLFDVKQEDENLIEVNDAFNPENKNKSDVFFPNAAGGQWFIDLTYELIDETIPIDVIITPTTETEESETITINY